MNKEKEEMFCGICNKQTKYVIDSFSRWHLKKEHNMNLQEYYDICFKKPNEGICIVCGKPTIFKSFYLGYNNHCSRECARISPLSALNISKSYSIRDMKKESEKRKITCLKRFGVECASKSEQVRLKVKQTCLERYGSETTLQLDVVKNARNKSLKENKEQINKKRKKFWTDDNIEKVNKTRIKSCNDMYGVDNVFCLEEVREKAYKTNEKKYKSKYYVTSEQFRAYMEDNGFWVDEKLHTDFFCYYSKVLSITNKKRKKKYAEWDGKDYYTNLTLVSNEEYRKLYPNKHYNTNKKQPTIDHKYSIFEGFKNNILPEVIGHIDNLVICSRSYNSSKGIDIR